MSKVLLTAQKTVRLSSETDRFEEGKEIAEDVYDRVHWTLINWLATNFVGQWITLATNATSNEE